MSRAIYRFSQTFYFIPNGDRPIEFLFSAQKQANELDFMVRRSSQQYLLNTWMRNLWIVTIRVTVSLQLQFFVSIIRCFSSLGIHALFAMTLDIRMLTFRQGPEVRQVIAFERFVWMFWNHPFQRRGQWASKLKDNKISDTPKNNKNVQFLFSKHIKMTNFQISTNSIIW